MNKASSSFGRLCNKVFENQNLKVSTKFVVYNAVCLSTFLYGAESWIPYRWHITNLEAHHIHCLQKIIGLSWENRVPNTDILQNTNSLCREVVVAKKHFRWIRHAICIADDRLPLQVLYGQLRGAKRSAAEQKWRLLDYTRDLLKRANINTTPLETLAVDSSAWHLTCPTAVSQIHLDRSTERRIQ